MPAEVEKTARKQLDRLKQMAQSSAEYTVQRTYLEWLVELPWSKRTEDRLDLDQAREILDTDHYDLKKVKKRILEYLAVRKLAPGKKGPILCLAGPPGVGKTSLGKSIARSLGREFIRVSLGGVRDEAEVRGHRRTYIGALPGRIIQGMRRVGHAQPGLHARRDRQAGGRLPRRPVGRPARGARPRAELHLLRPLPGGELRPLGRHLHRHGEHARSDPAGAARPHGGAGDPRLHPRGEAGDRQAPPGAEAGRRARARRAADQALRRGAQHRHRAVHARGGGAQPRARDRQRHPRRRGQGGGEPALRSQPGARDHRRHPRAAAVLLRGGGAHGDPGRLDGPGLDADRRRHPLHRGLCDARQGEPDPHRSARRRHEGVGARRPLVGPHPRRGAGHHHRLRADGHPPARPAGRPCRRTVLRRAWPSPWRWCRS